MATATAPARFAAQNWSDSDGDTYRTPSHLAETVAWNVLTHSATDAADIGLVLKLPNPEGLEAEDMWSFLWELIGDAARIGYLTAKIEPAYLAAPRWDEDDKPYPSTIAIARAVAALIGTEIVEDEPGVTVAEGAAV